MAHCMVDPDEAYEDRRGNEAGFNDWPQEGRKMNTWRDIKADPPRDMQPAIVTDGVSVWAGLVRRYDSNYPDLDKIYATNLGSGEHENLYLEDLTQWQPAPGYQPQKTADEMFAELGVYKTGEAEQNIRYESGNILIYVNKKTKEMEFCCIDGVEPGIILACARLIEEMEAEK